jgi:hypothetical protein
MDNQDMPLRHPDHNPAGNILFNSMVKAHEKFADDYNNYFGNLPDGHRHNIVHRIYTKPYVEAAAMHDTLAVASHAHRDYKAAANHFDTANGSMEALHQVLHYNLGGDHPVTQSMANYRSIRENGAQEYRNVFGFNPHDTTRLFREITNNLGQQFKPGED